MNPNDHDQAMHTPAEEIAGAVADLPPVPLNAPPKKRRILPLVITLSAASFLLIVALAVSAVLFLPLLREDTVTPALRNAFPEGASILSLFSSMESDGGESELEACVPKSLLGTEGDLTVSLSGTFAPNEEGGTDAALHIHGSQSQYSHDLSLVKGGSLLAVSGLLSEGYLTIDLDEPRSELRDSILYPHTSTYSLSMEEYTLLVELLESIRKAEKDQLSKADMKVLEDALESICDVCQDVLRPEVKISWRDKGFGLKKQETLTLERDDLALLLDEISQELENNDALRDVLQRIIITDETGAEADALLLLESSVEQLLKNKKQLGTLTLCEVSEAGRATLIRVSYETPQWVTTTLELELSDSSMLLTYTATTAAKTGKVWVSTSSIVSVSLNRSESRDTTRHRAVVAVTTEILNDGKRISSETETLLESELTYYKKSNGYTLTLEGEELSLLIKGTWQMNGRASNLALTVTDVCSEGVSIYDAEPLVYLAANEEQSAPLLRFTCRVSKKATVSFPKGLGIALLTEEKAKEYTKTLPLKELGDWMVQCERTTLVKGLSFEYHLWDLWTIDHEDYVITRYYQPYCAYVRNALLTEGTYASHVLLYDEEKQICLEIYYEINGNETVFIRSVAVDEANFDSYMHIGLDANGVMIPHEFELSAHVEPTCTTDGYDEYSCMQCAYKFRANVIDWLGHDWRSTQPVTFTNGLGEVETWKLQHYCARCSAVTGFTYGDVSVSLQQQPDGTHLIKDQHYLLVDEDYHYLPELEELDSIRITGFTLDAWCSTARTFNGILETPSYFTTLPAGSFYRHYTQLQAMILPGTLQEIEDGAFHTQLTPRFIFYRGTAEEWAAVELNQYRTLWQDVPVIFIPDGITREALEAQLQ